jgi:DNA-binding MarR family transcriptional regulator
VILMLDVPAPGRTSPVARRPLTKDELAVWRSLLDTTAELRRVLGAQMQQTGLSPADYQVMLALTEAAAGRLRSSELAATIDWDRSRVSHHLARMERRGLVRREDCATDSRGAEVSLTEDGAGLFRRATAPHMKAIKRHFAEALTPQQLVALGEILHALQHQLHDDTVAARGAGRSS